MTPWFNLKYLALLKSLAAVPAEGILFPPLRQALFVGSHITVKLSIVFIIGLVAFNNNLVGQSRLLQGRVISNRLETLPGIRIQNGDTTILGETDLEGRFQINLPEKTQTIVLRGVGLEPTTITLNDTCTTVEVVMILAATFDFMSSNRIDRLRLKEFKQLPDLYIQAYKKGLFTKRTVCYSQQFEPKKTILDSIRKEMIKQEKQNKITFDSLKVGDIVRVPFSTEYNSDGTHGTTLIVYSMHAYKPKYDCIIEAVIIDKTYNNNGYNLVCKITSVNLCKPESIYNGKTMKIGEVFVHNMKYFKVLTE